MPKAVVAANCPLTLVGTPAPPTVRLAHERAPVSVMPEHDNVVQDNVPVSVTPEHERVVQDKVPVSVIPLQLSVVQVSAPRLVELETARLPKLPVPEQVTVPLLILSPLDVTVPFTDRLLCKVLLPPRTTIFHPYTNTVPPICCTTPVCECAPTCMLNAPYVGLVKLKKSCV